MHVTYLLLCNTLPPKLEGKTHVLLFSLFLCVRSLVMACLGPLLQGLSLSFNEGIG